MTKEEYCKHAIDTWCDDCLDKVKDKTLTEAVSTWSKKVDRWSTRVGNHLTILYYWNIILTAGVILLAVFK